MKRGKKQQERKKITGQEKNNRSSLMFKVVILERTRV